ncbi:hypothetical protein LCGC14_1933600 [marine sediment metagenome]|uniref:Uncharacterized protein n=1 Tax=marine sediment metagenome TaxID=412755 RepID=A0A0F9GAN4_9ZZZZ
MAEAEQVRAQEREWHQELHKALDAISSVRDDVKGSGREYGEMDTLLLENLLHLCLATSGLVLDHICKD